MFGGTLNPLHVCSAVCDNIQPPPGAALLGNLLWWCASAELQGMTKGNWQESSSMLKTARQTSASECHY